MIAAVAGRRLRLIVHHQIEIFRLVGRRDRHEGGEHLVVGVAAADDLLRRAGLAADVIAVDVGEAGRAMRRVRAQQIAHRLRCLVADDLLGIGHRGRLVAHQERRLHQMAAVDQRGHAHQRLQRRDVEALAEGDRHRVEFAPMFGDLRLGALRQLRLQPVELAHLAQERLMPLHADHQRHARRADVGGMGEHLRDRQHAMRGVEIVDGEMAGAQAVARVDMRAERDLAGIERHRDRQRLEGRAHLIGADVDAVDLRPVDLFGHVRRIVGIVVGQRLQRDDLAGVDVDDGARRRLRLEFLQAGDRVRRAARASP